MGAGGGDDFFLWCCVYPWVGIVKGCIVMGPIIAWLVVVNTLIAILNFPFVFLVGLWSVLTTNHLGFTAKFMMFLAVPLPLATWPAFVAVGSVLAGIGIGFGVPFIGTYDSRRDEGCCFGGIPQAIKYAGEASQDFWKTIRHSFYDGMRDWRTEPDDHPFDLPLHHLIVGIFVAVIGAAVDIPCITVIAVVKYVPMMFRFWYYLLCLVTEGKRCEVICWCGIPWVICMILVPVIVTFGLVLSILGATFCGFGCAIVAHKEGLGEGFRQMWKFVVEYDKVTSRYLGDRGQYNTCRLCPGECDAQCCSSLEADCTCGGCACCPRGQPVPPAFGGARPDIVVQPRRPLPDPVPRRQVNVNIRPANNNNGNDAGAAPNVTVHIDPPESKREEKKRNDLPIQKIWDNVFTMCDIHLSEALDKNQVARAEVDRQDRYLFRFLPTITVVRALHRSLITATPGILLADGVEVNEENRPHNALGNLFYEPLINAKAEIAAMNLDENEMAFLERAILQMAKLAEDPDYKLPAGFGEFITDGARRGLVLRLAGILLDLGTRTSRLPQFRRRCEEIIEATSRKRTGGGSGPASRAGEELVRQASIGASAGAPGGPTLATRANSEPGAAPTTAITIASV